MLDLAVFVMIDRQTPMGLRSPEHAARPSGQRARCQLLQRKGGATENPEVLSQGEHRCQAGSGDGELPHAQALE
jgi:hypothetical protein